MVRNDAFVGDNDEHLDSDEKYMFEELDCSLKSDTAQEIARDWIEVKYSRVHKCQISNSLDS